MAPGATSRPRASMTRDPPTSPREVAIAVTLPSLMPRSPVDELSLVMILPPRTTRSNSMRSLPDQYTTGLVTGECFFFDCDGTVEEHVHDAIWRRDRPREG